MSDLTHRDGQPTGCGPAHDGCEGMDDAGRRSAQAPSGRQAEGESSLQRRLYDECVTAGWDPDQRNTFAEEIAHIHEEVSEAFRAWRLYHDCDVHEGASGKLEGVPIEFADVLIGLFYNAELHGFDLLEAVETKHRYNLTRNYVGEGRQLHPPEDDRPAVVDLMAALEASLAAVKNRKTDVSPVAAKPPAEGGT